MLDILKLDADVTQEVEKDTLGGGGGGALPSDLYSFVIKAAYFDFSKGKAMSVNLKLETDTGRRLNVTEYITSGEAKGCKPYYEKNGQKFPLPGYAKMNTLCQLVTGKPINELTAEDKILKLYDFNERKETNQSKKVISELTNQPIKAGVFKIIEDKVAKNESFNPSLPESKTNLKYVPTGETREVNEVAKFFNSDGKTIEEVTGGKDAAFAEEWNKAHQGKTKDKSTKSAGGATAGAPTLGNAPAAPTLNFS
tara:strand:+ start:41010 stop:41768 length:759 start_codon:yes stop_codon:yes gene_type:complete